MVYVQEGDTGYAYLLKGYKQDFFRFNTVSGVWDTSLPMAPAGMKPKWDKGSWIVLACDSLIFAHKAKYHELWTFNLHTHTWATAALAGMPLTGMMGKSKKSKDGGSGAWSGEAIFAVKGGNTQEFWRYSACQQLWTELETIPAFGSTGKKKRVKAGADITCWDNSGVFFALKGNKTLEMWRYVVAHAAGFGPSRDGIAASPLGIRRSDLSLAPNPATAGKATLRYSLPRPGPATVRIFDAAGRLLGQSPVSGRRSSVTLDLRGLAAGVYLVKLDASGYQSAVKLVVR
jgi:hypothetical protein